MAIIDFRGVRLRPMLESDQERVLGWRSDPDISRVMYSDVEKQSLTKQLEWYRRVSGDPRFEYWIIERRGTPLGVANLAGMSPQHERTDWAFYLGEPAARGSGVGAQVEYAIIYYVFFRRGFSKLCCQVLSNNLEVVRLHEKFGFVQEGVLRRHLRRHDSWLDVVLLAMHVEVARERAYDQMPIKVQEQEPM